MYIIGDIVPGIGRVEFNHCGLPWPSGIDFTLFGVVQVRDKDGNNHWCDAISGKELTEKELEERKNNEAYDYENKLSKCKEWREKNKDRYERGRQIDYLTLLKKGGIMINLGDKVKDIVTGFTGIAVCKTRYLNGCDRVGVQAPSKQNEKPIAWQYFDEPQLKALKKCAVNPGNRVTGGYKPDNAEKLYEIQK